MYHKNMLFQKEIEILDLLADIHIKQYNSLQKIAEAKTVLFSNMFIDNTIPEKEKLFWRILNSLIGCFIWLQQNELSPLCLQQFSLQQPKPSIDK